LSSFTIRPGVLSTVQAICASRPAAPSTREYRAADKVIAEPAIVVNSRKERRLDVETMALFREKLGGHEVGD